MTKKKVLLIEDDEVSHLLLKEYLLKFNVKLLHKSLGKSGLELFKSNYKELKLVFIDIRLPDADGTCIHHEMRKITTDIPLVAFTALDLEIKRKCLHTGFDAVIEKPIDFVELDKLLSKYL